MPACPDCGQEAAFGDSHCPRCGRSLPTGPPGAAGVETPGAGAGTVEGEAGATRRIAWEDPAEGFLDGLAESWRASLFEPSGFFRRVAYDGPFLRPLLYFLLVTVIGAFFTLLWDAVFAGLPFMPGGGPDEAAFSLVWFFATPFAALAGLAIGTLVYHLFVLLVAPDRRTLGATARVICYSAGPSVFTVVPILGPLVGLAWTLVLQVVGFREAHRTTTPRSLVVVFGPPLVALMFGFLMVGVALLVATR